MRRRSQLTSASQWLYTTVVLFALFNVPFRLGFPKSEESSFWVSIGVMLDLVQGTHLLSQLGAFAAELRLSETTRMLVVLQMAAQLLPQLPFNTIAYLLLVSGTVDIISIWGMAIIAEIKR